MGKFSEIIWPSEYSDLKRIEELLVCGICYDYMETSVMTPCSHNYCSLCIRKYLHYKNQCPACFQDTFEKDLHTNRILDEIILYFSKIRDRLVTCISGAKRVLLDDAQTSPISPPVRPARSNHQKSPDFRPKPETPPDDSPKLPQPPFKSLCSPSTSGTSKVASFFTSKSPKFETTRTLVPCPVCRVKISELHINRHLDDCLKRQTEPNRPPRVETKRKPLPKLVFCLMKDTELKKKLKLLNLSIRGDRKTLENRYHRYCTLYNAECDKISPRSIEELLKQCEDEEELERKTQAAKSSASRLNISRNSNQNVIEAAQREYLESNKDKFDNLIKQIKSRKTPKPPVRRSLISDNQSVNENNDNDENSAHNENSENHETTENNEHNEDHENNENIVKSPDKWSKDIFENAFQNNDSNDSCLLQTYTSEHPMNFLALGMSDNSSSPKKMDKIIDELPRASVDNTISNEITRGESQSVYDQTTDPETDDDQGNKGSLKRAKLSLEEERRMSEARILAMTIAHDFCDDDSSDAEANGSGRGDKENDEGESIAARRPVRKRNHPSRFRGNEERELSNRLTPIDALREEINGNKDTLAKGDATLKRRRRRKCGSDLEDQALPPRRPVRKREASGLQQ
ncbi:E3 ubiquitin-protein ligase RAD18-like [Fopius arisanus]|uniref:RING-type E3 ubiquitin transferase n=2 Tax=Braconidae TaxID=7402 RepID=A0A9R1TH08_9HYME|nr:PREDICTED: E3 ubiquitin-protein ligase RAD18-like [Fopius arisanus]